MTARSIGGYRLPLGGAPLEYGMTHEQMPHDGAQALRVRRDALGTERRDNDTGVGGGPCEAAIAPDDAEHVRADRPGELQSAHEVHGYVARHVAAAHREDEHGV